MMTVPGVMPKTKCVKRASASAGGQTEKKNASRGTRRGEFGDVADVATVSVPSKQDECNLVGVRDGSIPTFEIMINHAAWTYELVDIGFHDARVLLWKFKANSDIMRAFTTCNLIFWSVVNEFAETNTGELLSDMLTNNETK